MTEKKKKLLTEYVCALVSGENPDKADYLSRCPAEDRQELSRAINTARLIHAVINSVQLPEPKEVAIARRRIRAAISGGKWR